MDISVVIPAYNEEENVLLLYEELKKVLDTLGKEYEIIFVDDGSSDNTWDNLKKINTRDPKVKLIRFQKNFGKSAALSAGFEAASGNLIITMDADMQDDPKEIPNFIQKINEGFDLVSGWKYPRLDPLSKTIPSKIANFLARIVTGVKIHDTNCGFKAYKKDVVKKIKLYGQLYRYIPALAAHKGFKVSEIKVTHHPRKFGKSKYGWKRLFAGMFDLITTKFLITYTERPMHFFGTFGFVLSIAGLAFGVYLAVLKFMGFTIGNRPLLTLSILLIVLGVQFISLGFIGEMITHDKQEKIYVIREKISK